MRRGSPRFAARRLSCGELAAGCCQGQGSNGKVKREAGSGKRRSDVELEEVAASSGLVFGFNSCARSSSSRRSSCPQLFSERVFQDRVIISPQSKRFFSARVCQACLWPVPLRDRSQRSSLLPSRRNGSIETTPVISCDRINKSEHTICIRCICANACPVKQVG